MNSYLNNQNNKSNLSNLILIGCNILNIFGNKIIDKYRYNKCREYIYLGKKLFVISLVITLVVYIFFTRDNYFNLIKAKNFGKNIKANSIRLLGSFLFIIGILCFIYYQTNDEGITSAPEN